MLLFCAISGTFASVISGTLCHMRNITGPRIRLARRRQNLTQEDLAARLQVVGLYHTRNTIAKIESGVRQVTDIELLHIAQALVVDVAWLFRGDDEDS